MPTIERNALNAGAKPIENDDSTSENTFLFSTNDLISDENRNIMQPEQNKDIFDLIGLGVNENGMASKNASTTCGGNIFDLNDFLGNGDNAKVQPVANIFGGDLLIL